VNRVDRKRIIGEDRDNSRSSVYQNWPRGTNELPFRRFWSAHIDALERHLWPRGSINNNEKEEEPHGIDPAEAGLGRRQDHTQS
jgi:hypothetical protein